MASTVRVVVAVLTGIASALVVVAHIGPVRAGDLDILHLLFSAGAMLLIGASAMLATDWLARHTRVLWMRLRSRKAGAR